MTYWPWRRINSNDLLIYWPWRPIDQDSLLAWRSIDPEQLCNLTIFLPDDLTTWQLSPQISVPALSLLLLVSFWTRPREIPLFQTHYDRPDNFFHKTLFAISGWLLSPKTFSPDDLTTFPTFSISSPQVLSLRMISFFWATVPRCFFFRFQQSVPHTLDLTFCCIWRKYATVLVTVSDSLFGFVLDCISVRFNAV